MGPLLEQSAACQLGGGPRGCPPVPAADGEVSGALACWGCGGAGGASWGGRRSGPVKWVMLVEQDQGCQGLGGVTEGQHLPLSTCNLVS